MVTAVVMVIVGRGGGGGGGMVMVVEGREGVMVGLIALVVLGGSDGWEGLWRL